MNEASPDFARAVELLESNLAGLFAHDNRIRAVGIGWSRKRGYGLRITRNLCIPVPASHGREQGLSTECNGVPVYNGGAWTDIAPCAEIPVDPVGGHPVPGRHPEQSRHRPPACGIQIQNYDDDDRRGRFAQYRIKVGTLGCFVRRGDRIFLLSNNHVIAGNNEGKRGDRILNPGSCFYDRVYQIAVLDGFSELKGSSPGASPGSGAIFNEIDAAVAELDGDVSTPPGAYLDVHTNMAPPRLKTGFVLLGEPVRKVGRTTGQTEGKVTGVKMQTGPIYYEGPGPCWFKEAIEIEGSGGQNFCDTGDSGSVVMDSSDRVIGLLFATNHQQSYCCPIESALQALNVAML